MSSFSISIDLSHLMQVGSALTKDVFPHLAFAVQSVADAAETKWKEFASGVPMPNGRVINPRSGQYGRSIMQRNTGDFSRTVYTELPYALEIEQGAPRRDMKTLLNSSLKVRISAAGKRYLIIPFRHSPNPNNVMGDSSFPQSVADFWKTAKPSHVLPRFSRGAGGMSHLFGLEWASEVRSGGFRPSGTGAFDIRTRMPLQVAKHNYHWGDRLSKGTLDALGVTGTAAKRMEGMYNFRRPGKTGGAAHSTFITFRTMVEGSKGWIRPATEGKWPARQTAAIYQPVAEEVFKAAVEEDLRHALPGSATH
jgi:hypothetical protein